MDTDKNPPLSAREAEAMGRQTDTATPSQPRSRQVVYGDVDGSVENEDQADAHHAEPDEHV